MSNKLTKAFLRLASLLLAAMLILASSACKKNDPAAGLRALLESEMRDTLETPDASGQYQGRSNRNARDGMNLTWGFVGEDYADTVTRVYGNIVLRR